MAMPKTSLDSTGRNRNRNSRFLFIVAVLLLWKENGNFFCFLCTAERSTVFCHDSQAHDDERQSEILLGTTCCRKDLSLFCFGCCAHGVVDTTQVEKATPLVCAAVLPVLGL